jgi:hypothetical protein
MGPSSTWASGAEPRLAAPYPARWRALPAPPLGVVPCARVRKAPPIAKGPPYRRLRVALAAASALALGCRALPGPAPFAGEVPPFREGGRIAIVGDLQRTSLLEFWRESNDAERAVLARAIAAERPALLAIGGDLIFDGSSAIQWAEFDALTAPIRAAGVPVVAAFGNHEYWGGAGVEPHFFARFPHLGWRHWYAIAYGPLRLVVLDSNVDDLTPDAWRSQIAWFERTLTELDGDRSVRGVVVLLHHPPYTNSRVTGDEEHVQRAFVPAFLRADKTLAMVSGHVHSYERFERSGKAFVVSGGGGGPRACLHAGARRRHPDDRFAGPTLRDFHFLLLAPRDGGLEVEVKGLRKGGSELAPMDRFTLPWPARRAIATPGGGASAEID